MTQTNASRLKQLTQTRDAANHQLALELQRQGIMERACIRTTTYDRARVVMAAPSHRVLPTAQEEIKKIRRQWAEAELTRQMARAMSQWRDL